MGEPVQHRVVDRGAQHLAERRGAERRVVVDVAGLGAPVADHLVGELVELEQVDADVGRLGERGDHVGRRSGRPAASARSGPGCGARSWQPTLSALRRVADVDLVLGTMYFGTRTDEATSFALLDRFVEAGGRVLDTANCYSFWTSPTGHGGQSEALLGRWLARQPGPARRAGDRDQGRRRADRRRRHRGPVGAAVIEREAARSLERLGDRRRSTSTGRTARTGRPTSRRRWRRSARSCDRGVVRRLGVLQPPDLAGRAGPRRSRSGSASSRTPRSSCTTSYVEPRPGAQVPGKDHRFGFVTDETVDYLDTHPEIDLVGLQPARAGQLRPGGPAVPGGLRPPGHDRAARDASAGWPRRTAYPASQVVLAWMVAKGWKPIVGVSTRRAARLALASAASSSRRGARGPQLTADPPGADSLP